MEKTPWESEGISRRAWYYRQAKTAPVQPDSAKVQPSAVQNDPSATTSATISAKPVFNGYNGNEVEDITRAEMAAVLEADPSHFVPNWYAGGFESRNKALSSKA